MRTVLRRPVLARVITPRSHLKSSVFGTERAIADSGLARLNGARITAEWQFVDSGTEQGARARCEQLAHESRSWDELKIDIGSGRCLPVRSYRHCLRPRRAASSAAVRSASDAAKCRRACAAWG